MAQGEDGIIVKNRTRTRKTTQGAEIMTELLRLRPNPMIIILRTEDRARKDINLGNTEATETVTAHVEAVSRMTQGEIEGIVNVLHHENSHTTTTGQGPRLPSGEDDRIATRDPQRRLEDLERRCHLRMNHFVAMAMLRLRAKHCRRSRSLITSQPASWPKRLTR